MPKSMQPKRNTMRIPVTTKRDIIPEAFLFPNVLASLAGRISSQVRGRQPWNCGVETYVVGGGTLGVLQVTQRRQLLFLPINVAGMA